MKDGFSPRILLHFWAGVCISFGWLAFTLAWVMDDMARFVAMGVAGVLVVLAIMFLVGSHVLDPKQP